MSKASAVIKNFDNRRLLGPADSGDLDLGLFRYLPSTWQNSDRISGRGWCMFAQPICVQDSTDGVDRLSYRGCIVSRVYEWFGLAYPTSGLDDISVVFKAEHLGSRFTSFSLA